MYKKSKYIQNLNKKDSSSKRNRSAFPLTIFQIKNF